MQVSFQSPIVTISKNHELTRRSANYHPSIWGDHFLAYDPDVKENFSQEERKLEELKEEVRKMLIATPDKSKRKLDLIDTIQRLGVSYHFENEIEASLQFMYSTYHELCDEDGNDLDTVALRFRLLRQQGHYVSSDVFNKFKNPEGNFKESLIINVGGMLSLYEAANYLVHGEDILEEALKFTVTHLESMLPHLSNFLGTKVNQALKHPIQKTLTRLGARQFMSLYQQDQSHNVILLNFAKLDFNILQKQHKKELSSLTKWWRSIDCPKKLPFARDRLVECYFWIMCVYFEPRYSLARTILTKVISMLSILDDIYDVYGTLDELVLLTDAIQGWHISGLDQLPPYMRYYYQALLDVYVEMEDKLTKEEGISNKVNYSKAELTKLAKAYFQEAKWFHNGHVPRFEEYMKVALVTGAYMMLATTSLVLMGESVSTKTLDWITNEPLIVRTASMICRLTDDMVGHEFEQERGHVASAVECYMTEYGGSKEEAYDEFQKRVKNAWKDINKERLHPTSAPMPVLDRVLNLARVINLLYKDKDGYTHSTTRVKEFITLVLVDPI
ncbi:hypothetical protein ACH5RR_027959 [Cinchona calisaya]|uniref:myrcene synthase n=1 Tax=Cinchona calisaya TaxID=153742 RepID=A0ABD2YME5_9GENT